MKLSWLEGIYSVVAAAWNLGPENDDNVLGFCMPDIIAVHYVCFIYTISHTPATLTDE